MFGVIFRTVAFITVILSCASVPGSASPSPPRYDFKQILHGITPLRQTKLEWCWLAAVQMVFHYFEIPIAPHGDGGLAQSGSQLSTEQCAIVTAVLGHEDSAHCGPRCVGCNFEISDMQLLKTYLDHYPAALRASAPDVAPVQDVQSDLVTRALSRDEIQAEIDAGRPVLLGIGGASIGSSRAQHAIVLVGYELTADGRIAIVFQDPFPFDDATVLNNPWYSIATSRAAFQYSVDLDAFNKKFKWIASIYHIRTGSKPSALSTAAKPTGAVIVPKPFVRIDASWTSMMRELYHTVDTNASLVTLTTGVNVNNNDGTWYKTKYNVPGIGQCDVHVAGGQEYFACITTSMDRAAANALFDVAKNNLAAALPAGKHLVVRFNRADHSFVEGVAATYTQLMLLRSATGFYIVFKFDPTD